MSMERCGYCGRSKDVSSSGRYGEFWYGIPSKTKTQQTGPGTYTSTAYYASLGYEKMYFCNECVQRIVSQNQNQQQFSQALADQGNRIFALIGAFVAISIAATFGLMVLWITVTEGMNFARLAFVVGSGLVCYIAVYLYRRYIKEIDQREYEAWENRKSRPGHGQVQQLLDQFAINKRKGAIGSRYHYFTKQNRPRKPR